MFIFLWVMFIIICRFMINLLLFIKMFYWLILIIGMLIVIWVLFIRMLVNIMVSSLGRWIKLLFIWIKFMNGCWMSMKLFVCWVWLMVYVVIFLKLLNILLKWLKLCFKILVFGLIWVLFIIMLVISNGDSSIVIKYWNLILVFLKKCS